jgi:hypothetical protein
MKYKYFGSRASAYVYQSLSGEAGGQPGQLPPRTLKNFVAVPFGSTMNFLGELISRFFLNFCGHKSIL